MIHYFLGIQGSRCILANNSKCEAEKNGTGKTLSERLTEAYGEEITSWAADDELGTITAAWRDPKGLYAVLSLCFSLLVIGHIQSICLPCMVGLCEDRFVTQWHSCVIWTWFKLPWQVGRCTERRFLCTILFPLQRMGNYLVTWKSGKGT
jgi:hypothetical protein